MPPTCGNPLLRDWMKDEMMKLQPSSSKLHLTYKKVNIICTKHYLII